MPRSLIGPAGTIVVGNLSWAMVLKLAIGSGWKPRGTAAPADFYGEVEADGFTTKQWNPRNYFSRRGQQVSEEDALAIAEVLTKALEDVPDHDAVAHKVMGYIDSSLMGRYRILDPTRRVNPFEYFSGENKTRLRRFIRFCRAGGFRIV